MEDNLTPQDPTNPTDVVTGDLVADTTDSAADHIADASEADVAPKAPGRFRSLPWKTIGALSLTTAFGVGGVALLATADGNDHGRPTSGMQQNGQFGDQFGGQFGDQQGGQQFGGQFGGQQGGQFGRHGREQFGGPQAGQQQGGHQQGGQFQGGQQQGGFMPGQPGQFPSARSGGS